MVKKLFPIFAVLLFFLVGCENFFKSNENTGENSNTPVKYSKEFYGEWLRMDAGETWYITSGVIKINGYTSSKTVSMIKQSSRVIEVTEGGRKYYLYASRVANTSFTGKIAGFQQNAQSVRVVGGGIGGIGVTISNLNDKANTLTATTDSNGNYTANDIIPGDEYEITPEGGTPVTVTPHGDGDDVGTVTITSGLNFKTSIRPKSTSLDISRLYANMNAYELVMEIENTGTVDCTAATYQLEFASDLIAESVPASQILGTVEPEKRKGIEIKVRCLPIHDEYEYKKIGITINDPISNRTWQDSVSLRFHKAPVNFNIRSNNAVSGVIIAPTAQAYPFRNKTSDTLSMPWSTGDYLVVFSGATADTEAVYSLGIDIMPDNDFNSFTDTANFESNDTEITAAPVDIQTKIMSYLHKNDIDYYKVTMGAAAPELKSIQLVNFAFKDTSNEHTNCNNDDKIQPGESAYLDIMVKNNANAAVNITTAALSTASSYVTLDKSTGTIGNLDAGYYQTLTYKASYTSSTGIASSLSSLLLCSSSYYSAAFRFTISDSCPVNVTIPFTVTFTDSWGNVWMDTFEVPVEGTGAGIALAGDKYKITEAANGNADGKANPHETHYLDIMARNTGTSNALGVTATLSTTSSYVTLDKSTGTIGNLDAGYYQTLTYKAYYTSSTGIASSLSSLLLCSSSYYSAAFKFTISDSCPVNVTIPFTVTFTDSWGNVWTDTFEVLVE
ncbi:MAG: hypothetical protein LBK62_04250 [Treponema sp.]|jgi:hypothetical protein|nr:hypothetical protein [Treponema sp.]